MSALATILHQIAIHTWPGSVPYHIPGLWLDGKHTAAVRVDPYQFYRERLNEIADSQPQPLVEGRPGGDWSANAIIYNLFPRVTTAFDHAADGHLQIGPNRDGWRETGTLLKCIALLPYIQNMGFNTIHLLPITSVGQDGKKGNLGSPYAIRNPYKLDDNLTEPALGLSADELFAGFVEAAHRLGLRVIMEFVLRTSAKDGDWIAEHPDWFYWIRADVPDRALGSNTASDAAAYGNPVFDPNTLGVVKGKVNANQLYELPPPPEQFRAFFTPPPRPELIKLEEGRYVGTLDDGTRVRVPGAFADWPPDDNQPPWGDVTYLRMYTHPDFNYIAYNTIRMYDQRLAQEQFRNAPLWDAIVGVIPHYQQEFGIDGVMIDMGHALPIALKQRIVTEARTINPDFAFWDENFNISGHSRAEGYNAVMGYWLFDLHMPGKVYDMIGGMSRSPFGVRFFAAPENHNTPRAASRPGGLAYARYALALSITIPAMPFVLSGFELAETQPINTGLGFSNDMLARYPSDQLPLFSAYAFNWTRPDHLVNEVRAILTLRQRYADLLNDDNPATFSIGYSDNPAIFVYTRHTDGCAVSVIANVDVEDEQHGRAVISSHVRPAIGVLGVSGVQPLNEETSVHVSLAPAQVIILEHQRG
ncbi:MAG: alpha-amylase family glycosyl hydrolase [Aggregatilineales bacterium]